MVAVMQLFGETEDIENISKTSQSGNMIEIP